MQKKQHKIWKIILINIGIILLLFALVEFVSMKTIEHKYSWFMKKNYEAESKVDPKFVYPKIKYRKISKAIYEKPPVINKGTSKQPPILFFGCSYTEGRGLTNDQNMPYKFTKLTGITTYNFGRGGASPANMLYWLQKNSFFQDIPETQMVIYTFIREHYKRILFPVIGVLGDSPEPQYILKNGKLVLTKDPFLWRYSLFIVKAYDDVISGLPNSEEHNYNLFNAIMHESYRIVKEKYPNAKFVILNYQTYPPDSEDMNINEQAGLKEQGFIVHNVGDLVGFNIHSNEKYITADGHPNEAAWDLIVPALIKNLNLQ